MAEWLWTYGIYQEWQQKNMWEDFPTWVCLKMGYTMVYPYNMSIDNRENDV